MPTFGPTNTALLTIHQGTIQSWTVPSSGSYKIECWGAQGGKGNGYDGGLGAYRFGEMSLTAGEVIRIIVGQAGTNGTSTHEGGGGGGSFVYRDATAELLCAAGGGGGSSNSANGGVEAKGKDGVITEAATSGQGTAGGAGGTGGNGGASGHGAAGGGWHTTGGTANWSPSGAVRPGSACKPGATYDVPSGNSQAYGGLADATYDPIGGFGGGAGAHGNSSVSGGGGGGYSGGGGGGTSWRGGGGGGSFVNASMVNIGGTGANRVGHGEVIITQLNTPPTAPTLVSPAAGAAVDPSGGIVFDWTHNDPEFHSQTEYALRVQKRAP